MNSKNVEKLQNTAQIEQFYEILDNQGEEKPCEISKFIFKTLFRLICKCFIILANYKENGISLINVIILG